MRIGYIRVSTILQNTDRQLDGVEIEKRFEDKCSGQDTNRPALKECLSFCRDSDTLIVHSMDRLARNLDDLRKIVKDLNTKGVKVQFIKENLIFNGDNTPMANLLLSIMGAFAEFERTNSLERQREGIAKAQQAGKYKGRSNSLSKEQVTELKNLANIGVAKTKLAKQFGVSRQCIYSYLQKQSESNAK